MSNIDSIIERINNLMAIAENEASSDNEAQMAFERAQKLINEYRIEDWKRDRTRTNKPIIERGVNVSKTTIYHQQGYLATIIAQANECRAYLHESRCGGRIEERAVMFVGEEDDVDAECSVYTKDDKHVNVVIHKTNNGNYCIYNQTDGKPLPLKHKKAPTKLSELEK